MNIFIIAVKPFFTTVALANKDRYKTVFPNRDTERGGGRGAAHWNFPPPPCHLKLLLHHYMRQIACFALVYKNKMVYVCVHTWCMFACVF